MMPLSMIARLLGAAFLAAVFLGAAFLAAVSVLAGPLAAQTGDPATLVYIGIADDPFYEPQPLYTGLSLKDRTRPVAGAEVALREARVVGRALGLSFALDVRLVAPGDAAAAASRAQQDGAIGVLLDLPAEDLAGIPTSGPGPALFNIRHADARWREQACGARLLHTLPSHAMLADALAQHLRARGWNRVLLLSGSTPQDAAEAEAARRSLAKFGLKLAADRAFDLTNDPRRRDQSNIALLTGGVRHDVIWLIDAIGEFGRYVPYATYDARPVIGAEGLAAVAWHWTWERHGAPQLNQRFRRMSEGDMTSLDWAAWAAVKAVIEAVQRTGAADPDGITAYLRSDALSLDLYKGAPGSFRPWNGQLRQPILLATHNAVIERAPLDGYEHRTDTLDTLGLDEAESTCSP